MSGQTADTPNTLVNLGDIATFNFKVVENSPPNSIFSKLLNTAGVQTTPQMARGYVKGSIVDFLNGQTAHVCDFKFIFPDLGSIIGELGLVSPVAAIRDAIKNAKLKALKIEEELKQEKIYDNLRNGTILIKKKRK
jgi:hypothetical protein